jgi:hypothetical protein
MSAAVPRAKRLEHGTNEFTQPAETSIPGELEAPPAIEVTRLRRADVGSTGDDGMTPLMHAAWDGLAGTVQALLDRGAEVNAKRSDGFNALALAAFFGHSQVVWLLLENGADLAATGRCETLPEMWADARGFVDIGDTLREARATKQVEGSRPSTAVIDEPARFPRPAENEKPQRADEPGPGVEGSGTDEAKDFETRLAMMPAPVAEESPVRTSDSIADILPSDSPEQAQQQPVIKQRLRASKTLPEILDPPPLTVPEFHPGSAFVARITSSRKNLVALVLAVWLVCGGIAAFLIPQVRKSLGDWRTEAVTKTTGLPKESNSVVESGTSVSSAVKTPSAGTTESTTAPASKGIEETSSDTTGNTSSVESTSRVESGELSEKGPSTPARGSENRAHPRSSPSAGNTVVEPSENKREFSAATSMSRSGAGARKQRAASRAVKLDQQTVIEEQPKPAAVSVEVSRSVLSEPARNASETSGSQPPPLNIISGKPKSKVIQWP